jgi:probable phosphoglycerate mutase
MAPRSPEIPVATRILLVRHGLSSFNLEGRIQGRENDSELSAAGEIQARQLGEALRELPLSAAWCSPLQRAQRTAELLLQSQGCDLTPTPSEGLLEIDLSPWAGLKRSELSQQFPQEERLWRESPAEFQLSRADGSTYYPVRELHAQAQGFWRDLQLLHPPEQDHNVLVVAHNGILRCLLLAALGLPVSDFNRYAINNCSLSVLNLRPGGQLQIESLNTTSHLGEPLSSRRKGPRLLLVRHGETHWNREGRFQGQIDIPLNERGQAQAAAAGDFLREVPLDRAYTSSMARPRQTAEAILSQQPQPVPLTSCPGLVEIAHGEWEGCLEEEIRQGWPDLLSAWQASPHTVEMPGGETIQQVWDRSVASWQRIVAGLNDNETALVVAHDAVNKTILCYLLGLGPADIWAVKQGNGGVSVIDYGPGGSGAPVVASLNLTSHLGGVLDRTAAGAL